MSELITVKETGITFHGHHVKGFVCDAQARALTKCTKGHAATHCAVYGCKSTSSNTTLHSFPVDLERRQQWSLFVKATRTNWTGPTAFSAVCSFHFANDCFVNLLAYRMGFSQHLRLNKTAVPTVYNRASSPTLADPSTCMLVPDVQDTEIVAASGSCVECDNLSAAPAQLVDLPAKSVAYVQNHLLVMYARRMMRKHYSTHILWICHLL